MSTKKSNKHSVAQSPESFADHLGELRTRLTWLVVIFIAASALAYHFRGILVHLVLSPIGDQKLVYLTPGGGFSFIFQIIIYAGLLLTTPFMIYHLYRFVAPALPGEVRGMSWRIIISSTFLMVAGICFGYFVAVPAALQFLEGFAGEFVQANLTAESYFNFLVAYVLGLGLLFQLPLLLVLWNWIRPLPPGGLLNTQRFVLVGSFVAAALITPTPDVFNQAMVAGPIIAVYQGGVISVYVMNRKRRRSQNRQTVKTPIRPVVSTVAPAVPVQRTLPAVSAVKSLQPSATRLGQGIEATVSTDGFTVVHPRLRTSVAQPRSRAVKLSAPQRVMPAVSRHAAPSRSRSIDGFSFV